MFTDKCKGFDNLEKLEEAWVDRYAVCIFII